MTFAEVKEEILNNALARDLYIGIWNIQEATTFQELITASLPYFSCGYRGSAITDALLAEFDPALLRANGIYYNYTGAYVAPTIPFPYLDDYEIFVLGSLANMTIAESGRIKVNIWGTENEIQFSGGSNSYFDIDLYNAKARVTLSDTALAKVKVRNESTAKVIYLEVGDEATINLHTSRKTQVDASLTGSGYIKATGRDESVLNFNIIEDPTKVLARVFENSYANYAEYLPEEPN